MRSKPLNATEVSPYLIAGRQILTLSLRAEQQRSNKQAGGDNDQDLLEVGNTSSNSLMTLAGADWERAPDLAIVHTRLSPMSRPGQDLVKQIRFSRRAGIQINHLCPAIVGEFKRMPSRQLYPDDETNWVPFDDEMEECVYTLSLSFKC